MTFQKLSGEFLNKFLAEEVKAADRFVIASDLRHNKHLFEHLPAENTKILTWFAERNQEDKVDAYAAFLPQVDLMIADRYDYLEQLQVAIQKRLRSSNTWLPSILVWLWEPVNVSKSLRSSIRLTLTNWI